MKPPQTSSAHVLIFPCPAQGHVNSMLNLAQLLALRNLHVTFLNTEHIHNRLTRFADIESLPARYPTLRFKTIPDGLPEEHPRSGERSVEPLHSVKVHGKPLLRDILVKEKVTCLVADGFFGKLANDLAEEIGVPIIHFRTIGASCFWTYFWIPYLFDSNELPVTGEEDMDRIISTIAGMENLLRCRDLPSFCRPNRAKGEPFIPLETIVSETHQTLRARAVIFNTFDDLEAPVLSHLRRRFPTIFTVGPLHQHRESRAPTAANTMTSNNSIWEEDMSCMAWLDSQPFRSVIYVSFGSVTTVTRESLLEFWYGLVNSKMRFLWVVRSDMIAAGEGKDESVPAELVEGTKERGLMVGWVPQVEVLSHKSVGAFMTHCGWNSTIESVVAGVPMICWPYFADQQVNSRLVNESWKVGLDMKDVCDRNVVENMVKDVMVNRKEEFLQSAKKLAVLAQKSVSEGGSSYDNLDRLIDFIELISQEHLRSETS
ncbi:7-deoxyloganetic acid glucosyltransferase-like [Arachis stenosperma]|uniref:7-deoxyloganetic acid glucosyltransferase-like n=1 Tax=Arachis stenosperma TaxID=217475 RepID=UPI0025ABB1E2|nr:7-deoxyloganetic acid glucosyltransferase-like [Arachis stenosperma]